MTTPQLCLGSLAIYILLFLIAGAKQVLIVRNFQPNELIRNTSRSINKAKRHVGTIAMLGFGMVVSGWSAIGWGIVWAIEVFAK